MLRIDLSRLNDSISDQCEKIFQQKMEATDGKICILASSVLGEIDLATQSVEAQIVLNIFANISCPISCFRFAASLYPYSYPTWPVTSRELSQAYMLEAIEVALNLGYDKKAMMILNEFQNTREFISVMQIANEMYERMPVSSLICSEVAEFIEQYKVVKYYKESWYKQ